MPCGEIVLDKQIKQMYLFWILLSSFSSFVSISFLLFFYSYFYRSIDKSLPLFIVLFQQTLLSLTISSLFKFFKVHHNNIQCSFPFQLSHLIRSVRVLVLKLFPSRKK